MIIYFYISIILINALIFFNFKKISKLYNIYDIPNEDRKKHTKAVPLIGSIFIIVSLIYFYFFQTLLYQFESSNNISIYLVIGALFYFFIGMYDDRNSIKPNKKLLLSILFLFILMKFDNNILLSNVIAPPNNTIYPLLNFNFPITILCILLFTNALNMFDGIDMQSGLYISIIFIIFILKGIFPIFSLTILISLIFFLILNSKGKIFFGDSGVLALGFIISYIFLYDYNSNYSFSIEEIFLIMYLPGVDLLRVAALRIVNNRHPFSPDRKHIHHYLSYNFNIFESVLLLILLAFGPYIINYLIDMPYTVIFFSLLIYFYIVINLQKKIKIL